MSYNESRSSSGGGGTDLFGDMALKVALLLLIAVVAPALVIGLLGYHLLSRWSTHPRRDWSIVVVLAIVCLAIGYHFFWPLSRPGSPFMVLVVDFGRGLHHGFEWDGWRLFRELLPVWAMGLVLGPVAICGFGLHEATRPKSPQQLAKERDQQKLAMTRRASTAAERWLIRKRTPDAVEVRNERSIVLGVPVEGGLLDWVKKRLFCLPLEYLILHAVVIGSSGSGKSETLIRIAVAAAKVLGWQVVYVDSKGDYKAAAKFLLEMEAAGIRNVRMFPLDGYNAWVGTRDALLSRLLAIDNIAEVTNAGQRHYQTVRENLVEMAINAPGGPPRNSQELLNRLMLTNGVLYDRYEGYPEQRGYLEALLERKQDALSAYGHYRAFFAKLHGKLDGTWSYDDCDAAYILLDGLAMPEITDGIGRMLLADFVNYATRKPWDKRVMFVFDEVGGLNVPVFNIFEKIRFRNVAVVVSSQDPSGLAHKPGVWDEVKRVLGNAAIKIVHRSEDAHEVIRRAGTVKVPDTGYTLDTSGMTTGSGTTRFREELKIDPNDVLRLKAGETFVVGPGDYERVRVAMRKVDQARFVQLYRELERRAKEEPPPLQRRQGGATIVDSTVVSPSRHPAPSPKQQPGSTPKNTNGKNGKPSSPTQKSGDRSASPGQPETQAQPAKPTPPAKLPAQQSLPPAAAPGQAGNNVDAPFPFPDGQPAPTQPGVLPMLEASAEEEEEDLLQ